MSEARLWTMHLSRLAAVHPRDPAGTTFFDTLRAVPEAPAKWALIAPPFWLGYHRLWGSLAVYLLVVAGFLTLAATQFFVVGILLAFMPGLYLMLEGNQLRRARLAIEGFDTVGVIEAPDEETAVRRFLAEWTEAHGAPQRRPSGPMRGPGGPEGAAAGAAPVRPRPGPVDAFGVMGGA